MNNWINELNEQALDYAAMELATVNRYGGNAEFNRLYRDKFAELIIRECCFQINSVTTGDYHRDEWDDGYDAGLTQAVETIEEHFGVKYEQVVDSYS